LGADQLLPYIKELKKHSPAFISAYPNAGLPNALGQYDETPDTMLEKVRPYVTEEHVQILGGCCGTTPHHIHAIAGLNQQHARS
jgi:5-methyltetrahydrofolate--homocysteine methyltransferase